MHHRHVTLVVFELLSFNEVEDTEEQNNLQHVNHDYIHRVDDLLVDCYLVLQSVVLNKCAVGSGVVIWFYFKVSSYTVLLNNFGSINLFFYV